jgi:hypothetical protein
MPPRNSSLSARNRRFGCAPDAGNAIGREPNLAKPTPRIGCANGPRPPDCDVIIGRVDLVRRPERVLVVIEQVTAVDRHCPCTPTPCWERRDLPKLKRPVIAALFYATGGEGAELRDGNPLKDDAP